VRAHYDVEALDAPKGGGFLLDTNALHRAAIERGGGTPGLTHCSRLTQSKAQYAH
jgi:hypothetical protein